MIWLLLAPAAIVALHLALGFHQAQRATEEWDALLLGDLGSVPGLEMKVRFDAEELEAHTGGAAFALARGDRQQAVQLLGLAYAVVEEAHPDRSARLVAVARLLRMASLLKPVEPLAPGDFQLARLGAAAWLARFGHYLLIAPAERFALRLHTLRLGFWLAFRVLTGSRRSIERGAGEARAWRAWRLFEAGAADWRCLDKAHLESFRVFVMALRAAPQAAARGVRL